MTYLEALDYAKSRKVVLPNEYYNEFTAAQRSTATTVAGLASLDQIKAVIDLVNDALAKGKTFKQFQDSVDQLNLGLPKGRLDNIFRTNIQVAYAQGRYKQQRSASRRPYLLYSAVNDSRTRPSHLARNGTILHRDHPWWLTNTPPCGYRCRCTVISLTQAQAEKRGISAAPPEVVSDAGWDFHPSEYDGVLAKVEANKLGALELLTKRASAQISGFGGTKEDVADANERMRVIRNSIFDEDKNKEVIKLKYFERLMKTYRSQSGEDIPVLDAALAAGYTYEGYKVLSEIRQAKDFSIAQSLVTEKSTAVFNRLQTLFPNQFSLVWRGMGLSTKSFESFKKEFGGGRVVMWNGLTSATTDSATAERYMYRKNEDVVATVKIKISGMMGVGVDVPKTGLRADEFEVTILYGEKIKITSFVPSIVENKPHFDIEAVRLPLDTPHNGQFSVICKHE